MNDDILSKINRLNFEDLIWIIFIFLSVANIYGDKLEKDYLKTNNKKLDKNANIVFEIILIVTFFIYVYFWQRNYKDYKSASKENKNLLMIKLLGSSFLIAGIICLLYFQTKNSGFIGTPAI